MSRAKTLMVQGTMSNVGKSLIVAGLCRALAREGVSVAPFKSQNMALNSGVTPDGREMGRAQVLQAHAAGIEPDVRMNPILLKPSSDTGSQVIVEGRAIAHMSASEYFRRKRDLVPHVRACFESLASEHDVIIIEGAGSPAEVNLRADDIVNMGMARMASSPVLLVGDIDPGGVFAQLVGTLDLLSPDERGMVRGLVVNKFRGDVGLFASGISQLEELCGVPVLGVVPYLRLDLDDEDSLAERLSAGRDEGLRERRVLDVAVLRLPHMSNFTDFNPLGRHDLVGLRYVDDPIDLGRPDLLILPGTKATLSDLRWLRSLGLASCVEALAVTGTPVLGICGGYQMMGRSLHDPGGEDGGGSEAGLGLLPVETDFAGDKRLTRVSALAHVPQGFFAALDGCELSGYEIHMGRTAVVPGSGASSALLLGEDRSPTPRANGAAWPLTHGFSADAPGDRREDGAVMGDCMGTYLHGLFDTPEVVDRLVGALLARRGLPAGLVKGSSADARAFEDSQLDLLADTLCVSLDMDRIRKIIDEGLGEGL